MNSSFLDDPLLDPRALAAYLNITEEALEKWRASKRGPAFVRVGRLIRYRQSDVDRWLREQTVGGDDRRRTA